MYRAIAKNKRNTVFIIILFILIIGGLGLLASYIYGDISIVIITLVISIGYALFQYFVASSLALSMAGAHQIQKADNPRLYRVVENLAITEGLPMPKVYIVNDPAPNAFATGRDPKTAAVAATTGLLEILTDDELEGVMAHEMGHVKNYDIRVSMIVFGLVVAVGFIADLFLRIAFFGGNRSSGGGNPIVLIFGLAAFIVAPLVAGAVQAAVSRQREYLADATGRADHPPPGCAGQRPREDRRLRPPDDAAEHHDVAHVARRPEPPRLPGEAVQHPPADPGAHRAASARSAVASSPVGSQARSALSSLTASADQPRQVAPVLHDDVAEALPGGRLADQRGGAPEVDRSRPVRATRDCTRSAPFCRSDFRSMRPTSASSMSSGRV